MIDIEPDVFSELGEYIAGYYPNLKGENEILMNPTVLPCWCMEEISNTSDMMTADSHSNENYANVDYEVRVYVHPIFGKRREARKIMGHIDTWFINKGFDRINTSFIAFDDGTKFQVICQYAAKTDGKTIYRR